MHTINAATHTMMKQKIRKAVIAVAGSGTRFLPATKAQPKEMLPIVDKPIIQYVVEEMVASGITDIVLVTKWDKKSLEDHFDRSLDLEDSLKKSGKGHIAEMIKDLSMMANFIYVRQKGPYGNGTPVLSAASIVGDEPFVFAWGDDLVLSKEPFTKKLIEDYEEHGAPVIGVQEVPLDQVEKYGIVKLIDGTQDMLDVIEKPKRADAPSRLAQFGRMVLTPAILQELKDTPLGKGSELWITDAIKRYVAKGHQFRVVPVTDGEWLTTGDPLNYLKAMVSYALIREDIGESFKAYLRTLSL
jgi:UTP--glucose-1-phosphate uridylyltransferase